METTGVGGIAGLKYAGFTGAILVFEYLQIPHEQFTILAILMVVDFAAGVSKQIAIDPQGLRSSKAILGALKKAWVLITILALALTFKGIDVTLLEFVPFVNDTDGIMVALLSILIMSEMYSITQNIYVMRTRKEITEFDAVSALIKKIGDAFVFIIDGSTHALYEYITRNKGGK